MQTGRPARAWLAGAAALAVAACAAPGAPTSAPFTPVVTVFVTAPPRAGGVPIVTAAPAAAPTATPPPFTDYLVVSGDTFWDIALRFRLSLDELAAANPGVVPDLIRPGDRILIPRDAANAPTPAPPDGPHVAPGADGLRLRNAPSLQAEVQRYLLALTALQLTGRSPDSAWLEVALRDGARGWVAADFVANKPDLAELAVKRVQIPPTTTPFAQAANTAPLGGPGAPPSRHVGNLTEAARQIFRRGAQLGNNPRVFAVVGDSNSAAAPFLRGFDRGQYDLGAFAALEDTVRFFRGSFEHNSRAAVIGTTALRLLTPPREAPPPCATGESLVACEYRVKKPSVALILLGTNDAAGWRSFEQDYRELVQFTVRQGIVPVLITKGDTLESARYGGPPGEINRAITRISREFGVPLLDLRAAVQDLPNGGMVGDGFHYSTAPDGFSTYFSQAGLNYGFTQRNLTALQALDAVRRFVIAPGS